MAGTSNAVGTMSSKRIDVAGCQVSPAHTQSTVGSGTPSSYISSSSAEPSTPPLKERLSRSRTRNGGRPLHRRGKSKCLETLEDLLREAGYEDTRISTPEAEEVKGCEKQSGMGAVVEFLSQFLPRTNATSTDTEQSTYYSRPTSPPTRPPMSSTTMSHSVENSVTAEDTTPRKTIPDVRSQLERLQHSYEKCAPPERQSRDSQITMRPGQHQYGSVAQPQPSKPSRAGTYLRNMTSKASLLPPPRPSSTPARSRAPFTIRGRRKPNDDDDDPSIIFSQRGNGEAEDEVTYYQERGQPPLPPTWLETVTKAVLSGGRIGGPNLNDAPSAPHSTEPPSLRPSRSTLSQVSASQQSAKQPTVRRGLTDQTNTCMPPPPLFAMLERGRAGRSESQVTRTRVVCRSAPGSRAASLTRSEKNRGRMQRRKKRGDDDRLPSLARHHTEDDAWNGGKGVPLTANDVKNQYLAGDETEILDSPAGASSDEEDEHEGELDLVRMLAHPKRQNSIRSLRKHLNAVESSNGIGRTRSKKSPLNNDDDWPYEQEDYGGYVSRSGVHEDEDDADAQAFAKFLGTLDNGGRERSALPTWGTRQ